MRRSIQLQKQCCMVYTVLCLTLYRRGQSLLQLTKHCHLLMNQLWSSVHNVHLASTSKHQCNFHNYTYEAHKHCLLMLHSRIPNKGTL